MPNDGFKDYIEKRTVAEIMEDYGEQKDEWVTLSTDSHKKTASADKEEKPCQ